MSEDVSAWLPMFAGGGFPSLSLGAEKVTLGVRVDFKALAVTVVALEEGSAARSGMALLLLLVGPSTSVIALGLRVALVDVLATIEVGTDDVGVGSS